MERLENLSADDEGAGLRVLEHEFDLARSIELVKVDPDCANSQCGEKTSRCVAWFSRQNRANIARSDSHPIE